MTRFLARRRDQREFTRLPEIQRIKVLDLSATDVLIFELPDRTSPEAAARFREACDKGPPGRKVLVVAGVSSISALRDSA